MKKIKNLILVVVVVLGLSNLCFADTMSQIDTAVNKWSQHYGLDPELVYAVIEQESNFNPNSTGASNDRGLMQVTPVAQADVGYSHLGNDIYDIDTNIMLGTAYLAKIRDNYVKSNDVRAILARYNGSSTSGSYANSVMSIYNRNLQNGGRTNLGSTAAVEKDNTSKPLNETVQLPIIFGGQCTVAGCDGVIGETWLSTPNGTHYRVCTQNGLHQYDIDKHNMVNGICLLCGEGGNINNNGNSMDRNISNVLPFDTGYSISGTSTCTVANCFGIIGREWYTTADGKHYKACEADHNHQYFISEHIIKNGKCLTCGKMMEEEKNVDNGTNQTTDSLFSDLPNDHWAFDDVNAMVNAGIVNGIGDGMLGTNNKITAEELLTMLSRTVTNKGLVKEQGESYIPTGMENEWSYEVYVNLTKVLGNNDDKSKKLGEMEIKLLLGNDDTTVMKNYKLPITREKVVNIMGAFVQMDEQVSSANEFGFIDWDNVNSAYKKRVNNLKKKDIFRGALNGDGTISVNPKNEITRVEAIALVNRLYKAL